jgi:hypothetical protein
MLVGFDKEAKQIVPIGVGEVQGQKVVSITVTEPTALDYLGYAFKNDEAQTIMQQFVDGSISFDEMVTELNTPHH